MFNDILQLNPDFTASQYLQIIPTTFASVTVLPGTTPITSVGGNTGSGASGPSLSVSGGVTGYSFDASGQNVTMQVGSALTVRTSIGAAESGANADINTFSALTGSSGWAAWTGSSDKTAHATYTGTASVAYVQAELQGVMDKLKQTTETLKAVIDTLLASGVLKV